MATCESGGDWLFGDDGADAFTGGTGTDDRVSYALRTGDTAANDMDMTIDGAADDGAAGEGDAAGGDGDAGLDELVERGRHVADVVRRVRRQGPREAVARQGARFGRGRPAGGRVAGV